jgi:uncharacterized protein YciI
MKPAILLLALAAALAAQAPRAQDMTTYYMAFLHRGPNTDMPKDEAEKVQAAHLAHIGRMAASGKLILAGPFMDQGDPRGIFVFKVDTMEEAKAMSADDPAVKAGRLRVEIRPWYASKGIQVVKQSPATEK